MALAAAALAYLGVPFRHRGRSRRGLDCAGLLILAAKDCGFEAFDVAVYGREPWRDGLQKALERNLGPAVERAPQLNDVLLLRLRPEAPASHLAVVAPYPYGDHLGMVHTYAEVGVVCHHRLDESWRARIVGVYPWLA